MSIPNYDNDIAMAEYGRYCARWKAINKAKETIRDNAVRIVNSTNIDEIKSYKQEFDMAVINLLEALELE